MKIKHFGIVFFMLFGYVIQAQVIVASIFSDNMVLQRNVKIPVWGTAKANQKIVVNFHNQTKSTTADKNGKWMVRLDNEVAGGPYVLTIKTNKVIQIKNVLVGEVWICSGQSNMEWTVGQSNDAENEIATANYPNIRHIKIPKEINSVPNTKFNKSSWKVCTPETVADFTGVGYFFAKQMQEKLQVPFGLINASWGGTNIETWISKEGFESSSEFKEMISQMPKIDLNALLKVKMESAQNRIEALQKSKFTTDKVPFYKDLNFDDTSWLELQQPQNWEEQSLGNFDGVVWLRKHFTISREQLNQAISLEIPAIDDEDITYVNGVKIGETKGWDLKRMYVIPNQILKVGNNVIAIRVVDTGGGGGIHGNPEDLRMVIGNTSQPLSGTWKFQVEAIQNGVNENEFPSLCYNAMISPLQPFAFQGVLWYQGESNAPRAYQYNKAFPLLIEDWRSHWKSDFPFYFVQLASFKTNGNSNEGCDWAELREAQTNTLKIKNTGMVVTTDLVTNPKDIHPTNKQDVGKRLAAMALNNIYQQPTICTGPTYKSFETKEDKLVVTFENTGSGLTTHNNSNFVFGFEIAGADQIFYPAKATLVSEMSD